MEIVRGVTYRAQIKVHMMCLAVGEEIDWKHLTRHQRFVRDIEAPPEMPLAMNWNLLSGCIKVSLGWGSQAIPQWAHTEPEHRGKGSCAMGPFYHTTAAEEWLSCWTVPFTAVCSELLAAFWFLCLVKWVYQFHFLSLSVKVGESTRLSYKCTVC